LLRTLRRHRRGIRGEPRAGREIRRPIAEVLIPSAIRLYGCGRHADHGRRNRLDLVNLALGLALIAGIAVNWGTMWLLGFRVPLASLTVVPVPLQSATSTEARNGWTIVTSTVARRVVARTCHSTPHHAAQLLSKPSGTRDTPNVQSAPGLPQAARSQRAQIGGSARCYQAGFA
jgi:hypothetical protein